MIGMIKKSRPIGKYYETLKIPNCRKNITWAKNSYYRPTLKLMSLRGPSKCH